MGRKAEDWIIQAIEKNTHYLTKKRKIQVYERISAYVNLNRATLEILSRPKEQTLVTENTKEK